MIRAAAPATIGNVGPGFDALGLAVAGLFDAVEASRSEAGIEIAEVVGGQAELPTDPERNTAGIAARETLKLLGYPGGVRLRVFKGLPAGSGLGSSAASAAAAAFAVNRLYGDRLAPKALVVAAAAAEAAVSGAWFADNAAPAVLGGCVLLPRGASPLAAVRLGSMSELRVVLATPEAVLLTRDARAALPRQVPVETMTANLANACGIVAAFLKNDYRLFAHCFKDAFAEPARSGLIPGFEAARRAALDAGADGFAISGAGPTMYAVCGTDMAARGVELAMQETFESEGIPCRVLVTRPDPVGARQVESGWLPPALAERMTA